MSDYCNRVTNEAYYKSLMTTANCDFLNELNFKYSNENEFNSDISGIHDSVDISVFHLNIHSLNKNSHALFNFLNTLNLKFDVIVLSEIWNYNLELYRNLLPDYIFYWDCCSSSNIGGIGVYVRNNYTCNVLDNFKVQSTIKNTLENIWLELDNGICKYIVGALYRHPNQNIDDFNEVLEVRLSEISKSRVPCLVVGDINIDLCKYSLHSPTTQYVDNLLVNNFRPVAVLRWSRGCNCTPSF